jgi:hypothetical protein
MANAMLGPAIHQGQLVVRPLMRLAFLEQIQSHGHGPDIYNCHQGVHKQSISDHLSTALSAYFRRWPTPSPGGRPSVPLFLSLLVPFQLPTPVRSFFVFPTVATVSSPFKDGYPQLRLFLSFLFAFQLPIPLLSSSILSQDNHNHTRAMTT